LFSNSSHTYIVRLYIKLNFFLSHVQVSSGQRRKRVDFGDLSGKQLQELQVKLHAQLLTRDEFEVENMQEEHRAF
jgi:hypothetical protein